MAQIELQLTLPRDARYVGVLRRVAESLLAGLDVPEESVDDVAVALSEACGNVIRHAEGTAEYGVQLSVTDDHCSIEVCDLGPGFDPATLDEMPAELDDVPGAERGRGVPLLKALMDDLQFVREEDTTTVRLFKRWEAVGLGPAVE
ncbi:MAG: ATP-binding protein [Actinobacteria bacterium]|nr:ATP-binding protein [Actinomycetota bacterium]